MNWNAIIASAEVIGAIAVVISLVYLAIQTRDSVRATRAAAVWDAQISFVEVNELLGDGGTVSKLVYKAITGEEQLSAYEKYLLHRFSRGWFQRMEAQFALYNAGILAQEVWELRRSYARAILNNPLFEESWGRDKENSMFTEAFIDAIDGAAGIKKPDFLGVDS